MSTTTLYELIKQKSKEKGYPLKVISDWDECLQPLKPMLLYELSPKNITFEEYFKKFWNLAKFVTNKDGDKFSEKKLFTKSDHTYSYIDPSDPNERQNYAAGHKNWGKLLSEKRKEFDKEFYSSVKKYEWMPFLSIAEDLLKCLNEGLIELVIISSCEKGKYPNDIHVGKKEKFERTFGKLANTKLDITPVTIHKKGEMAQPYRWNWIKEKYPDFDIFIDDNTIHIEEASKLFPDKIYVVPDYEATSELQGSNIYHVKTTVSNLKNEDFTKAAEEYKEKTKTSNNKCIDANTESFLLWFGLTVLVLCGLGLFYVLQKRIKKKR